MEDSKPATFQRAEPFVVLAICILFLWLNWFLGQTALVGPDEPGYSDPAASLYMGQGFTSGAWYAQSSEKFWAGNVPLHEIVLYGWYRLFGFNHLGVRMLSALYVCVGVLLVWDFFRRTRFLHGPGCRLFLVATLLCVESTFYVCQAGRPDGITYLLAALAIWSFALRSVRLRYTVLFVVSALVPWSGLQLAVALGIVMFTVLISLRGKPWREFLFTAAGGLIGVLALVGFYAWHGVWPDFLASILPHTAGADRTIYKVDGFISDRSYWFLVLATFGATALAFLKKPADLRLGPLAWAAMGAFIGLPIVLFLAGKFPAGYAWMPSLVGIPILLVWVEQCSTRSRLLAAGIGGLVAFAAFVGYPRIFIKDRLDPSPWTAEQAMTDMAPLVKPSDYVIYSGPAFYPSKSIAEKAFYVNWYLRPITEEEKKKVSLLLVEPQWISTIEPLLGRKWEEVGPVFKVPVRKMFRKTQIIEIRAYRPLENTGS